MRLVEGLKPFRGVGRVLSLVPLETAFERNKKPVFMHLCGLSKSAKYLHIRVTALLFPHFRREMTRYG